MAHVLVVDPQHFLQLLFPKFLKINVVICNDSFTAASL
jgi:hypothetical protein